MARCAKFGKVRSASGKMVTRCKAFTGKKKAGRLGELRGDVMRCVRYGKAVNGQWRCAEYAGGPGTPKRRPDIKKDFETVSRKTGEVKKKTRHIPYSYSSAKAKVYRGTKLRGGGYTSKSVNTKVAGGYRAGHGLGRRTVTTTHKASVR